MNAPMQSFTPARLALLLLLPIACAPAVALANDVDDAYDKAAKAFDAGRYAEAARIAADAAKVRAAPKLVFVQARAMWKLGRAVEAEKLLNLFHPKELPDDLQEAFVEVYAAVEKDAKAERARGTPPPPVTEPPRPPAKHDTGPPWRWIATGATAVVGAGLMAYGLTQANAANDMDLTNAAHHQDYKDRFASARLAYWSGVGALGIAVGLGTWAAIDASKGGRAGAAIRADRDVAAELDVWRRLPTGVTGGAR